jgi:hypothetical protein
VTCHKIHVVLCFPYTGRKNGTDLPTELAARATTFGEELGKMTAFRNDFQSCVVTVLFGKDRLLGDEDRYYRKLVDIKLKVDTDTVERAERRCADLILQQVAATGLDIQGMQARVVTTESYL